MALVLNVRSASAHERRAGPWAPVLALGGHVLLGAIIITISSDRPRTRPVAARPMEVRMVSPVLSPAMAMPAPAVTPSQPAVAMPKPVRRAPSPAVPARVAAPPTPAPPPEEPAAASSPPTSATGAPTPTTGAPTIAAPAEPPPVVPARFDAAYLDNPKPIYPPAARRRGETGKVLLRVLVSEDGTAVQVEVKGSSGSPSLDQAALDAVARWKFVAARQGDAAARSWVVVPVDFSLN